MHDANPNPTPSYVNNTHFRSSDVFHGATKACKTSYTLKEKSHFSILFLVIMLSDKILTKLIKLSAVTNTRYLGANYKSCLSFRLLSVFKTSVVRLDWFLPSWVECCVCAENCMSDLTTLFSRGNLSNLNT